MPWREMPMDLAYKSPSYPSHDYSGEGQIVLVRVGGEIVGYLSRKGWSEVGWLPAAGLSSEANVVRVKVNEILRVFAAEKRPMVEAWAEVLNNTQHDEPKMALLDELKNK